MGKKKGRRGKREREGGKDNWGGGGRKGKREEKRKGEK